MKGLLALDQEAVKIAYLPPPRGSSQTIPSAAGARGEGVVGVGGGGEGSQGEGGR